MIEAVPEKMEIKHQVFAELDAATPGHAILASNTSGLSITEIGEITSAPGPGRRLPLLLAGVRMRLVEIIEGDDTLPETAQAAANFAQQIRKVPVRAPSAPASSSTASCLHGVRDLALPGRDRRVGRGDRRVVRSAQMPMGPFRVADMSAWTRR